MPRAIGAGARRRMGFVVSAVTLAICAVLSALFVLPAPAAAGPRAVLVEPARIEKGEVEPDDVLKFEWTLRNSGDAPLSIEAIEPTCYCTTGKADAMQVPPGGATTIRVTIDPSDFSGAIDKGIEIQTNDPQNRTMMAHVTMTVRPGIAVVPPEIDFGAVPANGSKEKTVDLKAAKARPFKVTAATGDVPWLAVEQEPMQTEDRAGVRLFVKVKPGVPVGAFATRVVVQTDDAAKPRIEIPVRGKGAGGMLAEPERLVFEAASPGAVVGTLTVRGDRGTQVTGVKSTTPLLEAALQPQADGTYRVAVTVASGAKSGRVLGKILVTTSDVVQPELAVPVMGVVK